MEFLFFWLSASLFVLVGGAAVGALLLMVCFPCLALMGKLTPVWVVILWSVAERTHGICVCFARDLLAGLAVLQTVICA